MSRVESLIKYRVHSFASSLIASLEQERELNELEKQGRTWNVIQLDGTTLQRGIRNLSRRTGTDDQRLLIQE